MQRLVSGGLAAAQAARLVLGDDEPAPRTVSASATTLEDAAGNLAASLDWLDLNQRPHPYQRSTAERRAIQRLRWSCDSVSATGMG
jgi:hypothetical protein